MSVETSNTTAAESPRRLGAGRPPWMSLLVILGGSYMFVLDTTVLGVALPDIGREFGAGEGIGIDWVVTAYLVSVGSVQPATGWLADRFGKRKVYVTALAAFTFGSVLAGLAPSMELLIVARVLQGLSGGAMQPTGMAMVYELFPAERRGTALGIWGVAIMAAPALGPPLGGWVTTAASWRWIFLINLPIGLIALLLAKRHLRETGFVDRERPLHWQAWVLAAAGILTVVMASRQLPEWGPTSPATLVVFAVGIALLVTLVRTSLRQEAPLIEFRIFRVRTFSVSVLIVALLTMTQFGRLTFLPVQLQLIRGLGADEVGLLLAPAAIGVAVMMPIGGWLADRIGSRLPVFVGLSVYASSTWWLGHLTPTTPERDIVLWLVVAGVGLGLTLTPNNVTAMNSLPSRFVAQAAAVKAVNRQVFGAMGTAVFAAMLVATLGTVSPESLVGLPPIDEVQASYNRVFIGSFWMQVVAAVLALALPGRRGALADQAARRAEEPLVAAASVHEV